MVLLLTRTRHGSSHRAGSTPPSIRIELAPVADERHTIVVGGDEVVIRADDAFGAARACVHARAGELDRAALALERASERLPRLTAAFWWLMIETRVLLAPVLHALGRRAEAVTRPDEAEALLAAHEDAGKLPTGSPRPPGKSTPSVGTRNRHSS